MTPGLGRDTGSTSVFLWRPWCVGGGLKGPHRHSRNGWRTFDSSSRMASWTAAGTSHYPAYANELSRLVEALGSDSAYAREIAAFGEQS